MNTRSAGLLGDPHDRLLHIARCRHHQVGQLVDDRDDVGIGLVLALTAERRRDLPRAHLGVEIIDVAHPAGLHVLVALLHLLDQPGQRGGSLLRRSDDRGDQMRNAFVRRQFHHLGVDEDHPDFLRRRSGEQRHEHRVDEAGLAGPGGAGYQKVRHLGQIGRDEIALDVLAQSDDQRVVVTTSRGGREHVG